jgi:Tfp pilus assembly PilM family ATPase
VIGEHEAAGGQRLLRVLLVAAHKEMLAAHLRTVREAGLRPAGIDLNPIAIAIPTFLGARTRPRTGPPSPASAMP